MKGRMKGRSYDPIKLLPCALLGWNLCGHSGVKGTRITWEVFDQGRAYGDTGGDEMGSWEWGC